MEIFGKWEVKECEGAILVQRREERAFLYTSFLCPTPPPSMVHVNPLFAPPLQPSGYFQAPLGPSKEIGKEERGRVDQDRRSQGGIATGERNP